MSRGAVVHIVQLPNGIPDGKTGADDALRIFGANSVRAISAATKPYDPAIDVGGEPLVRCLADVENKVVDYIWQDRIARGAITMFSGDPGSAKTFLALSVSSDLTRGRIPASTERCTPLRVMYATTENSGEHVIGPRFRAMGGDDKNLILLDGSTDSNGNSTGISFGNLAPVDRAIEQHNIDLLFFDPVQSYFGADADFHKANEVRPRMDALMRLAAKYNIAIVLIRHLAKSSGGRAIHRGLGSVDFTGSVRIEMLVGNEADQPNNRAVVGVKNNLGLLAPSLAFSIEGKNMGARLVWKGASTLRAADLLAPEGQKRKTQVDDAVDYLRERLADGPRLARELEQEAEFSTSALKRASRRLGVVKTRQGESAPWVWSMSRDRKFARKGGSNGSSLSSTPFELDDLYALYPP